jgi:hypothetical protein
MRRGLAETVRRNRLAAFEGEVQCRRVARGRQRSLARVDDEEPAIEPVVHARQIDLTAVVVETVALSEIPAGAVEVDGGVEVRVEGKQAGVDLRGRRLAARGRLGRRLGGGAGCDEGKQRKTCGAGG